LTSAGASTATASSLRCTSVKMSSSPGEGLAKMIGVPPAASMQAILISGSTWQPGDCPQVCALVAAAAPFRKLSNPSPGPPAPV
jgi:hypothetical protein